MTAPAQRILPLAILTLVLASACNNATSSTAGKSTGVVDPAEDPKQVVATFDGITLTLAEVDKPIRGQLAAMEAEFREQKHKLRQAGVESLVVKRLVEKKAKAAAPCMAGMLCTSAETSHGWSKVMICGGDGKWYQALFTPWCVTGGICPPACR